ncbi:MAG TPA: hypothetical protein ENJ59_02600 [Thermofilum sp.]|nr:hypothetical protein [Thermofilum sp.]
MAKKSKTFERIMEKVFDIAVWEVAAVILGIILLSGLFYAIIDKPPAYTGYGAIYPSTRSQTTTEVFIVALGYGMGALGFYLILTARKYVYNPRYTNFQIMAGALIVLLAFLFLTVMYASKGG